MSILCRNYNSPLEGSTVSHILQIYALDFCGQCRSAFVHGPYRLANALEQGIVSKKVSNDEPKTMGQTFFAPNACTKIEIEDDAEISFPISLGFEIYLLIPLVLLLFFLADVSGMMEEEWASVVLLLCAVSYRCFDPGNQSIMCCMSNTNQRRFSFEERP